MNKQNRARLQALQFAVKRAKLPEYPEHLLTIAPLKDNSANGLTKCIITFLNGSGHFAERINTTGRYQVEKKAKDCHGITRVVEKGKWIPGTGTKGSADISATIDGRSVKIEVKYGADRQSVAQRTYQQLTERAGGLYIIARTFDEFLVWYDSYMAETNQRRREGTV